MSVTSEPRTVLRWQVSERTVELDTATGLVTLWGMGALDATQAHAFAVAVEQAALESDRIMAMRRDREAS